MPMLRPMLRKRIVQLDGLAQLFTDAPCDRVRHGDTRQPTGDDHELVAAHAHHQVVRGDRGTQAFRDGLQQPVTNAVTLANH